MPAMSASTPSNNESILVHFPNGDDDGSDPPAAAVALPAFVTTAEGIQTLDPATLHFRNPRFYPPLLRTWPRSAFDLPTLVAPSSPATDQMLFEAPKNATQRFFLPGYGIASVPGSGGHALWIAFDTVGSGYRLTVNLVDVTPASLSQGNGRLSPSTRYLITASLQGRMASWDLTVAASSVGATLTLVLDLASPSDRDLLYSAMTEPSAQCLLTIRRSLDLAVPFGSNPQQPYARRTVAIDSTLPFTFNKDLNANIFAGLRGATGAAPTWTKLSVNWNGRAYPYFQASNQPSQIYFLPDAFKVGRQTDVGHRPALAVTAKGTSAAGMQMTLSYLATPVWDPQRIAEATKTLQGTLALPQPPTLALLEATDAKLWLNIPASDPAAGQSLVAQDNALIDVSAGVQGAITLGLAQFRDVYDAIFDQTSALLTGEVRVKVGADTSAVPFVARIADMTSDVFEIDTVIDTTNNKMAVVLRNAIESPIHVEALNGVILRGGKPIPSSITATAPVLPCDVAPIVGSSRPTPANQLLLALQPSTGQVVVKSIGGILGGVLGGGNTGKNVIDAAGGLTSQILDRNCVPFLDFGQVRVVPDPKAVWRAMMRDQPTSPVSRDLSIKLVAASLKETDPAKKVFALQVVFEAGQTASFDASQTADAAGFLSQTLKLSVPLETFVLGTGRTDTYTYRIDLVTATGVHEGSWKTDNRDTLYVFPVSS